MSPKGITDKLVALFREGAATDDPQKRDAAGRRRTTSAAKSSGCRSSWRSPSFIRSASRTWRCGARSAFYSRCLLFYLFEWLTSFKVVSEIPAGNVAVAVFASRLSFAAGLLMAALISY